MTFHLTRLLAIGALTLAAAGGPNQFSTFGNATVVSSGHSRNDSAVELVSDTSAAVPYAGISYTPKAHGHQPALTLGDISTLSATYKVTEGGIGGGSPRFQIGLDEDGEGTADANVFVYIGTAPNFTDPTGDWTSTGNLIDSSDMRFDTSQIGGTFYDTYDDAVALAGDDAVVDVSFVVDAGWFFPDGVQTVLVSSLQVDNAKFKPMKAH
jgi:hypothetical protein